MTTLRYVTIAVTDQTRDTVNAYTAWAIGTAGRRMSNSEAITAALTIARRHPDEVAVAAAK